MPIAIPFLGHRLARTLTALACAAAGMATAAPAAESPGTESAAAASAMDAPLFYQLLIGELELRQGAPATAYAVLLDAARRTRDEDLFERAMDIALRAQAGNEAWAAAQAWRQAHPQSLPAIRAQVRILLALNRLSALAEPLGSLLRLTPEAERNSAIAGVPRLFRDHPQPQEVLRLLQQVLLPWAEQAGTRLPAQLALARGLAAAGQGPAALALAQDAARLQPDAPGPALLALELLNAEPQAQALIDAYLALPKAESWVRFAYAQWLVGKQQTEPALEQLRRVVRESPDLAQAWFTLGLVAQERAQAAEAEAALRRYLELATAPRTGSSESGSSAAASTTAATADASDTDDEPAAAPDRALTAARSALAQLASARGDHAAALAWLDPLDPKGVRPEVQARRAAILAKMGKLDDARQSLRRLPADNPQAALERLLAESQLLRTAERWREAQTLLSGAASEFGNEVDFLYEWAMVLERLERHAEMERHLRRIMELQPKHHHAHNALGYSLAERGVRLAEARTLIQRALELAPGDPFITDSLAWVAYKEGRLEEAEKLLRTAYAARPDTEIGIHLGEVLWARGDKEQARSLWREQQRKDGQNKLLRDTLRRLKVKL